MTTGDLHTSRSNCHAFPTAIREAVGHCFSGAYLRQMAYRGPTGESEMRSPELWMPRRQIRLGADESLLERIRHRIYQRLCDEGGRLDLLVADLLDADLNAAATYAQLRLLGHRLDEAATAYDSPPIVEAARALEAAALDAMDRHSNNQSEPVWQAIGRLIQLLPMKAHGADP